MSCSYCPNSVGERIETGHMSWNIYSSLIDQLKKINFRGRLSFDFYNEPLLSDQLESFIEHAKSNIDGISVHLYTNGTRLELARFRTLASLGVDRFVVTRHENVKNFIFEKTWEELDSKEKSMVIYRNYMDLKLTNRGGVLPHIRSTQDLHDSPCMIPSYIVTVTSKGNVLPCFEDFYQKNQMGNILDKSIDQIWYSRRYVLFRNELLLGKRFNNQVCSKCSRQESLMGPSLK